MWLTPARLVIRAMASVLLLTGVPNLGAGAARPARIAQPVYPAFSGYVVDTIHLFDDRTHCRLTQRLGRFERETKHQMAIVSLSSLGGLDLATYSRRLGHRWGVGRRGYNDGILIVLVPSRGLRIAVGDGLRTILPNAFLQGIIDDTIMPLLRRERIAEGVEAGVIAILRRFKRSSIERRALAAAPIPKCD